tara:strand:- start:6725 stop:7648 length:924 start_codon:yes stop_codon:yes gene_type:complete
MFNINLRKLFSFSVLVAFLYFLYIYFRENQSVLENFYNIEIVFILLFLALNVINYFFRSYLNIIIFRCLNISLKFSESFQLTYKNTLGNLIGPLKAGSGYKMHYIYKNYKLEPSKYIALNTSYAILAIILNFLVFLFCISYQDRILVLNFLVIILYLIGILLFVVLVLKLLRLLQEKTSIKILDNLIVGTNSLFENKVNFLKIVLTTIFYILLNILTIFLCFDMFSYNVNFLNSAIYSTIGSFSTLIKVTPGNIGLFEALMISSVNLHNVEVAEVLTSSVFIRLISYLTIGLIYFSNLIRVTNNRSD